MPIVALLILILSIVHPYGAIGSQQDLSEKTVPLLQVGGGIGFDDLGFSSNLNKVIVPGGQTGELYLIDPSSKAVTSIKGFSTQTDYQGGHSQGITSADEGVNFIVAIDRNAKTVNVVDPHHNSIITFAPLSGTPDYVRFIGDEVWVTEPSQERIEVFHLTKTNTLTHIADIQVPGGPESLIADTVRGKAYSNLWKNRTVVMDIVSHGIVEEWANTCAGSRGIALDQAKGFLVIGCAEGKAVVLDAKNHGRVLGNLSSGSGVDIISFNQRLRHVYLPGAKSATLAVLGVSEEGRLSLLGTTPTTPGAHCVTTDNQNNIWVCDPQKGQLLEFKDEWPAS